MYHTVCVYIHINVSSVYMPCEYFGLGSLVQLHVCSGVCVKWCGVVCVKWCGVCSVCDMHSCWCCHCHRSPDESKVLPSNLKLLNLEVNKLTNWSEVLKLTYLVR